MAQIQYREKSFLPLKQSHITNTEPVFLIWQGHLVRETNFQVRLGKLKSDFSSGTRASRNCRQSSATNSYQQV